MFRWGFLLIAVFQLFAGMSVGAYEKPENLTDPEWEEVQPLLLPDDHPIKGKLDKMFAKGRWTESLETLEDGKFVCIKHKKWDNVVVAKHSKLPGYVLKIYTDDQVGINVRGLFINRTKGAGFIQHVIDINELGHLFSVPKKWMYVLPKSEFAPGLDRKDFILVTEDMNILDSESNYNRWKSSKISKELLKGLFTILSQGGLLDSVFTDNIPFSRKDGRVVFIDTEHYQRWPIRYDYLTKRFSKSNQVYWKSLFE